MKPLYFADAWYFIARLDRWDSHHLAAKSLDRIVHRESLVTHDGVFSEVLAHFSDAGAQARAAAVQTVRRVTLEATVIPSDRLLFARALDLYARRPDKEYSLVDCMSMVVMEERGIRHVLTNDHHFAQAGFVVVNS